jgi:RNA polymerase sigma-32 factor
MISQTAALPSPPIGAGLPLYLTEISKFPVLSPEELMLSAGASRGPRCGLQIGDQPSPTRCEIAMRYRGYGLPIADVVSEGNVGLMQAVKRFEPERGFRLATYARWWVKASIQEYILRSWSLVR